jgi:hypothetical protein
MSGPAETAAMLTQSQTGWSTPLILRVLLSYFPDSFTYEARPAFT